MLLHPLADGLLSALLAPPCAACGGVLERPLDGAVCEACWRSVHSLTPPVCDVCSDALPSWRAASVSGGRCPRCRRASGRAVSRLRAVGAYDGTLKDIIHAFKYEGRRSLAAPLGRLMAEAGADVLSGADAVVPVPLHGRRRRTRGFNQAELLANGLGPPVWQPLARMRVTAPQVSLPRARRHANVRGAFVVAPPTFVRRIVVRMGGGAGDAVLKGRVLVLVDDVTTTGATLEACGRALREAGASDVRALTAARAVSGRP